MKTKERPARVAHREKSLEEAEARAKQAAKRIHQAAKRTEKGKTLTELAETRTELAETRTELAETRTELAEIRTERAEKRVEQVESLLQHAVDKSIDLRHVVATVIPNAVPLMTSPEEASLFEKLTKRQRDILQLLATGQNTKQTSEILKLSPKTVEYHRLKMMRCLDIHDVPGLVRFAIRVGLIGPN